MRRALFNADDAGFDAGTDRAILATVREGPVRSVSVVAGGPTSAAFLESLEGSAASFGWHVNLTEGRALSGVRQHFANAEGVFDHGKRALWQRALDEQLDAGAVREELEAQYTWFLEHGVRPVHVDGHNHVHALPQVAAALDGICPALPRRATRPLHANGGGREPVPHLAFLGEGVPRGTGLPLVGFEFATEPSRARLKEELGRVPEDLQAVEFMVHPGARPGSPFTEDPARDREREVLAARGCLRLLEELGWTPAGLEARR